MESHLSSNDYYEEGGKVSGEWFGSAGEKLGLAPGSEVSKEHFAALGGNRHPITGEQLTARNSDRRKSWTDVQFSAPKSVSILAVVGGDERIKLAFDESVKVALREMETFAGTRERRGLAHAEDRTRATGNLVAAMYRHDASRSLDPQLHTHCVIANATWDTETSSWRALQAREMMQASAYARRVLYADLAARLEKLGYEVVNRSEDGFQIRGVEELEARYSGRTEEIDKLAAEFEKEKGRAPSNKERAVLVRESRSDKLQEISTPEVRASQVAKLTAAEKRELDRLTAATAAASLTGGPGKPSPSPLSGAALDEYLDVGLDHVTEHASVGNDWEALAVALDHAAQAGVQLDPAALRARFDERPDVVKREGWLFTTETVLEREREAVALALAGRGSEESPLADVEALEKQQLTAERPLLPEQLAAARTLAASRDRTTILVGDAGTGKTSTLSALRAASAGEWTALGPTTGAVDELRKSGFEKAATMQSYLDHPEKWAALSGGVVLLDEAGAVGSKDLHAIQQAAKANRFRLVCVGDVKQHASVTEGDALRAVLDESTRQAPKGEAHALTVARLSTVLRQRVDVDRKIAETLGKGDFESGLDQQEKAGHVNEQDNEKKLFQEAAAYAVQRRRELAHPAKGSGQKSGVLVIVTPRWSDAEKLAVEMRPLMRADGQLVGEDRRVSVVEPVALTSSQKRLAASYTPEKSVLTFTRKDEQIGARAGENWLVTGKDKDGLFARRMDSDTAPRRIAWADLGRNTQVGRLREIELAAGDDILLRAEARNGKRKIAPNGSVRTIERITEDGKIHLRGGGVLPADFKHFSHGYGKTSHKAQGSSEAEAMIVMGAGASEGATRRQWYVSSTRHQLAARYFVASVAAVRKALGRSDDRQLAGEMVAGRKRQAERSQATGAAAAAAAVAAVSPAPAEKAAPVVAAAPVPSPAPVQADASGTIARAGQGFFASRPMASVPPSRDGKSQPNTESQMQEQENKPAKLAAAAIRDGKLITYAEVLGVEWKPLPGYTPAQNEYAKRYLRVELWDAKIEQDAELARRGISSPEQEADRAKNESAAKAQIGKDRAWMRRHSSASDRPAFAAATPAPAPAPNLFASRPAAAASDASTTTTTTPPNTTKDTPMFAIQPNPERQAELARAKERETKSIEAKRIAALAGRNDEYITNREILSVSLDQLHGADKLSPEQQEYALRERRRLLAEAKEMQDAALAKAGIEVPGLAEDHAAHGPQVQKQLAEDRDWIGVRVAARYSLGPNPDKDFRPSEEIKWSRLPDQKLVQLVADDNEWERVNTRQTPGDRAVFAAMENDLASGKITLPAESQSLSEPLAPEDYTAADEAARFEADEQAALAGMESHELTAHEKKLVDAYLPSAEEPESESLHI